MRKKSINFPVGGLDQDSESRVIDKLDYRYAKNIRNSVNAANKGGSLTNVLGNLQITTYTCPYNGGSFPSGRNKCIGAVEDTVNTGAVFFVWNSEGKHGIYRYRRNQTNPDNPYGVVEQVIQYDFGWTKRTRITSITLVYGDPSVDDNIGDLCYWCDPKPRKINLTKGNVVGEQKSWNIYLPITVSLSPIPIFTFKDFDGAIVYQVGLVLTDPTDRSVIISDIATYLNANASSPVTAEACDCHLVLTEKTAGRLWTIETDQAQIIVSPDNWYGATLIERFFDRCKWQPLNAPQATFEKDTSVEPNYVQKKVFQFRLGYIYDDREPSALGVWSQIPINNLGCDGTSDTSYNYIDVDFNDTLIPNAETLVLLKRIRFIAIELNDFSNNRNVIDLEACDFLDYRNGSWYCHFEFFNNIISTSVDAVTAAKLFDDVPLTSQAEQIKDNRIIEANCLTGYDAPECVSAKAQQEYAEDPNPTLYEITGFIRIFNPFGDNNSARTPETTVPNILERRMPIVYDSTAFSEGITPYPFFGGVTVEGSSTQLYFNDAANGKRQLLPEGGFPVYAAGTDYFTVSRQKIASNTQQRSDGSIDASNDGNKDQLKAFYQTSEDLYSNFSLKVPAGEYIIRLGSHWCSFNDKLGKGFPYNLSLGRSYQQTSTFVWGVIDNIGTWKYDFELKVTVTNSDVFIGEFVVSDLVVSNVDSSGLFQSLSGYVFDNNGQVDVPALSQGVTVEKGFANVITDLPINHPTYQSKYTDHNGFFYFQYAISGGSNNLTPDNRVDVLQVPGTLIHNGGTQYYEDVNGLSALARLFDESINTDWQRGIEGSVNQKHREIICPVDNPDARAESSTFIIGSVVDSMGNPISGLTVLYEHGRTTITQSDGSYSLLAWGDLTTGLTNNNRIVDNLFFNGNPSCQPEYPNGQEYAPVLIDPFGANTTDTPPPYSPTANYPIPDFIVAHNADPTQKALKRGGNYLFGGRGYDDAGRLCSVFPLFQLYTPFITEDIGKYGIEDFGGVVYPSNTFRYGKPTTRIVLDPATVFPSWMKYLQIMMTKNTIYGRYLQWVANEVTYISALATDDTPEIKTTFQNRNATAIKISIKNIVDYSAQNNNSQVGYQYQAGDRVRIITNRSLEYINGLNDFEVTSYDSETQEIIIKPEGFLQEIQSGNLFEVFNPKSVSTEDSQIFYEVGEVIKVNNGIPESYSTILTGGDTYWRGRTITVNDESTKFAAAYPVVIEDASVSDFYPSLAQDIGRTGVIDPNFKQILRPMLLKVSNTFIPSTAINGLSSFEALNEKELDRQNGGIQRLLQKNQQVVAVSSLRELSNYIQVVQFQQASEGDGIIAIANQYFGTTYPHTRTLGTDMPASVFMNDSEIFGYHSGRSDVWLYLGDGERAISDVKMKNYFNGLGNDGVSDAVAVYDRFHEEYILTVWRKYQVSGTIFTFGKSEGHTLIGVILPPLPIPIVGEDISFKYEGSGGWITIEGEVGSVSANEVQCYVVIQAAPNLSFPPNTEINATFSLPETISWFNSTETDQKKRWITFYDFTPECYCQAGSDIISFKDGEIWIHNKSSTRNNFYGEQYKTHLTVVSNEEPDVTKGWYNLYLEAEQEGSFAWSAPIVRNNNGQLSRLLVNLFQKKEEYYFSQFNKDLNTAGVVSPIVNGRLLRSSSLELQMENNSTEEITIRSIISEYEFSPRQ